jgi:hypothetical protein
MAEHDEFPPLVPDNEIVVADEMSFVEACKAALSADAQAFQWVFGKSVVSRSQRWGLIWRVDFVIAGRPKKARMINRAMCWGGVDEIQGTAVSFGQSIAPLE